jgi:hypothetical protein
METTLFKKIIQYRIQWEMKKMDTQLLTSTKTMINVIKELSDAKKKKKEKKKKTTLKEEIWEKLSEKFMEKIFDMVNQNVQDVLKKFQDTKNKEQ